VGDKPRSINRPRSYTPWSAEDDIRLRDKRRAGMQVADLAKTFGRTPNAIRSRLKALGLK